MSDPSHDALRDWIGRCEVSEDMITSSTVGRLAALLDHERPPWHPGEVPPLGHWLGFLPAVTRRHIDVDGHPRRGGFMPPIALPRRMWAGGSIDFHGPLPVDTPLQRRATILDIEPKTGATGAMVFVTVRYEVGVTGKKTAIEERQTIVYREAATKSAGSVRDSAASREAVGFSPSRSRPMRVDSVQLFRFSALTFNAHRIHYDRDYARDVEGYAGLVVHGPLAAMLLMDEFLRRHPQARPSSFSVRAMRPLIDGERFSLQACPTARGEMLRIVNDSGEVTMKAQVVSQS